MRFKCKVQYQLPVVRCLSGSTTICMSKLVKNWDALHWTKLKLFEVIQNWFWWGNPLPKKAFGILGCRKKYSRFALFKKILEKREKAGIRKRVSDPGQVKLLFPNLSFSLATFANYKLFLIFQFIFCSLPLLKLYREKKRNGESDPGRD